MKIELKTNLGLYRKIKSNNSIHNLLLDRIEKIPQVMISMPNKKDFALGGKPGMENVEAIEKGEKEKKDSSIYVKVTDETRKYIDKFKDEGITISKIIEDSIKMYKNYHMMPPEVLAIVDKYEKDLGEKIKVIEQAIKCYDEKKEPAKTEDIDLWIRAREELGMMLIGKTTFKQLLTAAEAPEESLDKPIKRNIAKDIILWYTGKMLKSLELQEIIFAIEKLWKMANYFYFIDVIKEEDDQFHIIFRHNQNERYSSYWLRYFTELFTSSELSFKCIVEGQALAESLSLTVKKAYDKKKKS